MLKTPLKTSSVRTIALPVTSVTSALSNFFAIDALRLFAVALQFFSTNSKIPSSL